MTPTGRRTLSQSVSQQLIERIRSGDLPPGARLPTEQGLMEEFGVGRNVAREAVQHLVALGVVDVRPRRGAIVSGKDAREAADALSIGALVDSRTVDDLYEFRMLLETAVASRAAARADREAISEVREGLVDFARAVETHRDVFAADVVFHQKLAEASGNIVYARVLDNLADILALSRRQTDAVPGAPEQALVEHTRVVEAIERGDAAAARAAMEQHIRTAVRTLDRARQMEHLAHDAARPAAPSPVADEPTID